MKNLLQRMTTRVSDEALDASIGAKLLYVAGLLLFVIGMLKIGSLGLDERQLPLALLLIIAVSLQIIVAGLLIDLRGRFDSNQAETRR